MEFEVNGNTIKAATPPFLMALILKEHIKCIKSETSQRHDEIGICLLDELNESHETCLKENIREACKLLNRTCTFVKI